MVSDSERKMIHQEKMILVRRPHWVVFLPCLMAGAFVVWFSHAGAVKSLRFFHVALHGFSAYEMTLALATIFVIPFCFQSIIEWAFTEYAVTNLRVIIKTGWLTRTSESILINKIDNLRVEQSILGRLLGYGHIMISSTGGSVDVIRNAPAPIDFRQKIQASSSNFNASSE